jgi:threonine/homoserine/homoserine lactone efflux protein
VAFTIIKWVGAAYLIYLGVRALMSRAGPLALDAEGLKSFSGKAVFWQGFLSDALNPKVAMFYLALLPQFVQPHAAHGTLQLLILGLTFNMVALPINLVLVLASSKVTDALRRNGTMASWLHKAMGAMFVRLGLRLAAERT